MKPPEVTQEDLEKIQRGNQRRLADFQSQGVAINIPSAPGPLVKLLIEAIAGPQGSPGWLAFIYAYEVKIRDMLDGIESQVARAKLTAPGPLPNGSPLQVPRI